MKRIKVIDLCEFAAIAAIYVILTVFLAPISYGDIQFRVSEVLMLLVLYKKRYAIPLILGCLIANCFSSLGIYDVLFGTLATVIAILLEFTTKNKFIAGIYPVLANALIVGAELYFILDLPFFLSALTVGLGELVVIYVVGIPLFHILEKNQFFKDYFMEVKENDIEE